LRIVEKNAGVTFISQQEKRAWMLEYIDGETPSAPKVANFWLKLTAEQKAEHLLDAFPDKKAK
jgi:hypothetical protein